MGTRQPRNNTADTPPQTKIMTAVIQASFYAGCYHCHDKVFDGYGKYDLQEQDKVDLAWLGF